MFFAYNDESGDPGYSDGSQAFTVATVCVKDEHWLDCLDAIKDLRRNIRDEYGVGMREEVKANHLIHGKGAFESIPEGDRKEIYLRFMRFQHNFGDVHAFAVVLCKKNVNAKDSVDPREYAWEFMIQKFERFADHREDFIHVLPDEGHYDFIRRLIRKLRRFNRPPSAFGSGNLPRDAENIIGDCSERDSEDSYFIQLADLNAYAAYRWAYPHQDFGKGYWNALGDARDMRMSRIRNDGPGLVVWPQ